MAIFECKNCGGTLTATDNSAVYVCEHCGREQTAPRNHDKEITIFYNRANALRRNYDFDNARRFYEKIISLDPTEAEAYWGMVLCRYGVEYVKDPATDNYMPTCHCTLVEAVQKDIDYLAALENADYAQRRIYEKEAAEIDALQKNILQIVRKEKPFDVFICYKEKDEYGNRTHDSILANDIYYQLTNAGFKVFYAAITLEDKLGQEYEPYIYAALTSAKVMLVVGSKKEYFEAVWVRNEWSRFIEQMKKDRSKLLIPCYQNMDAYDLPEEFIHFQAQDMGKVGFIIDLIRGVEKICKKEELEKKAAPAPAEPRDKVDALIRRMYILLEDGDWDAANKCTENILNLSPECGHAYLGKLMIDLQVAVPEGLVRLDRVFTGNRYYKNLMKFADPELKDTMVTYAKEWYYRSGITLSQSIQKEFSNNYDEAMQEIDKAEKQYENARKIFDSIEDYKDAPLRAQACATMLFHIRNIYIYEYALRQAEAGQREDALETLKTIAGYKGDQIDADKAYAALIKKWAQEALKEKSFANCLYWLKKLPAGTVSQEEIKRIFALWRKHIHNWVKAEDYNEEGLDTIGEFIDDVLIDFTSYLDCFAPYPIETEEEAKFVFYFFDNTIGNYEGEFDCESSEEDYRRVMMGSFKKLYEFYNSNANIREYVYKYVLAVAANSTTSDGYEYCIKCLALIPGYRDAEALVTQYRKKIQQYQQEENARQQREKEAKEQEEIEKRLAEEEQRQKAIARAEFNSKKWGNTAITISVISVLVGKIFQLYSWFGPFLALGIGYVFLGTIIVIIDQKSRYSSKVDPLNVFWITLVVHLALYLLSGIIAGGLMEPIVSTLGAAILLFLIFGAVFGILGKIFKVY